MIDRFFSKRVIKKDTDPISNYILDICKNYKKSQNLSSSPFDVEFAVIDTETTGLEINTAKIINVAAVKIKNFQIVDFYDTFIDPGIPIPKDSMKWHHITDEMVKNKPSFVEIIPEFLSFLGNSFIVGHHITFDMTMINKEMKEVFACELDSYLIDTMFVYSRGILGVEDHLGLDHLFKVYKVSCSGRHTALGDALATAEVFNKMITGSIKQFKTVGDLVKCHTALMN